MRSALANDNRMCLCGIMSAELDDLPPEVRTEVDKFAEMNVGWIASVIVLAERRGLDVIALGLGERDPEQAVEADGRGQVP